MKKQLNQNPQWSKTSNGNLISLWSWNTMNTTSRPLLIIGGVHGDEPEGVWLAENLLLWLQTQQIRNSLHQLQPGYLITCLNPDGYGKNERTNGKGVDLNRNFPTPDWSSECKAPRYFPGPKAGSEPEVASVVQLIDQIQPKIIIHFHSWEPCIVYTGAAGKNTAELFSVASGYESKEDIGYPTPGSLGQYGWHAKKIPVVCIEEKEGTIREHIWPRWRHVLQSILKNP